MKLAGLSAIEQVSVFKQDALAGTLARTERGARFTYDEAFRARAIAEQSYGVSFTLSPTAASHEITGSNLHPFFAGLLPEGLRLKALRSSLKTSEDDLFTMLLGLGTNCIGDVYVESAGNFPSSEYRPPKLNEVSFWKLFEESVASSDSSLREVDSGIPGVVPKLSSSMISFPLRIHGLQQQYILKLGAPEHPQIIQNEHFFMRMAKQGGIESAHTEVVKDKDGILGLLVHRFDRFHDKSTDRLIRFHQEDACQFLDRYPQDKYRLNMREIAIGIERLSTSPLIEFKKLLELYVFSYLIGNGDLHAKNISLRHDSMSGRIELTPAYDVLSTLPYGDRTMALKLGARDDSFSAKDFIEFGALLKVPEKAVRSLITRLLVHCDHAMNQIGEIGWSEKIGQNLKRTFQERAKKLNR